MFHSKWALWVAHNKGEALDQKPGARTLKLPSAICVAKCRNIDHVGNGERTSYYNRHKFVSLYVY